VLQQSADNVLITDRHGRIQYVNPAVIPLGGYTLITVTDHGCVIPRQLPPHISEPF